MKTILLSFIFLTIISVRSQAQFRCAFDDRIEKLNKIDPNYKKNIDEMNTKLRKYISDQVLLHQGGLSKMAVTTVYIPCVVHVIHTGAAIGTSYNPTDATIISAINYLNSVYDG